MYDNEKRLFYIQKELENLDSHKRIKRLNELPEDIRDEILSRQFEKANEYYRNDEESQFWLNSFEDEFFNDSC